MRDHLQHMRASLEQDAEFFFRTEFEQFHLPFQHAGQCEGRGLHYPGHQFRMFVCQRFHLLVRSSQQLAAGEGLEEKAAGRLR